MGFLAVLAEVLLIGHSLVGPVMPGMLEQAFRERGVAARVDAQVINGAPLRYNWDHSAEAEGVDARVVLPNGGYDIVVMTEAVPFADQVKWNDTAGYAGRFFDLATGTNPEAETWLYEVWPPLGGDDGAWRAAVAADLPLWQEVVATVNSNHPEEATPMRLLPVGQALAYLSAQIEAGQVPGISATSDMFSDDIHLNGRGLYFVTMVIHSAITGESPVGLATRLTRQWASRADVLSADQARVLQEIAWDSVTAQLQKNATLGAQTNIKIEAQPPKIIEKILHPDAAPQMLTGIANPSLGLGLAGIDDWSVQQPFIDVMKTARPWIGHLPGQWGGWGVAELAAGGYLDANGWPRAIPPELTGITTLILTDLPPEAATSAGRYRLLHAGEGTLLIEGRARNIARRPGEISFDFTPGDGAVQITIAATDADNPLRDIRVIREDQIAAWQAGAMFNPDWIGRIRGARMVRFMDWMATNGSTQSDFSTRAKPSDYSWARKGVPLDVMVALANELRADPWFTLPHRANDAYFRSFAEHVRDHLAPSLRAHVEYSNEVWNWQFEQARWAEEQALNLWGQAGGWVQYYGMRAARMADIWAEVFGPEADARLVRVVATQTGWPGLEAQILAAPLWLAHDHAARAPVASFDAYAVTGYFSGQLGSDVKLGMVRGWLRDSLSAAEANASAEGLSGDAHAAHVARHRFDLATQMAAAEMADGAVSGTPDDTLEQLLGHTLPYHAKVAKAHGLDLMMYEGGSHVVGNGTMVDEDDLTAFFIHLNYTPEMGNLYTRLRAGWHGLSDAPFNAFVDVYRPNKWGSWGALRHLGDENPRWQALARAE